MESQSRYDPGISGIFTGTLLDVAGTAIPLSNIVSVTLTLTNDRDGSVVNSRNSQNVLNTNNVTINATTGAITWLIQAADTAMVDSTQSWEDHVATFTFTYETNKVGIHRHRMHCVNYLGLCSIADVEMLMDVIPPKHQPMVEWLIEVFSERAEAETTRSFKKSTVASPTVEYFSPKGETWHFRLSKYPIDSIVSVIEAVDGDFTGVSSLTWVPTDYAYLSDKGLVKSRYFPFTPGEKNYQITYVGGLALHLGAVPPDLRFAAARQVAFWYQRRNQAGLQQINIARAGREVFDSPLDLLPEVRAALNNYCPVWA